MAYDLIEKCNKYIKKGKIDKLYEEIKSNNLTQDFLKQVVLYTYNGGFKGKEYENVMNTINFALKISMDDMKAKYGEKLTNKFSQIIYNTPEPIAKMVSLFSVMNSRRSTS